VSSPGWLGQGLGSQPIVVVVVCGCDVVGVVVVDDVVEVVVAEGWDGSSVVGEAIFASGAATMAGRGEAVVGGMLTLTEVVWSAAGGSGAARDDEPVWSGWRGPRHHRFDSRCRGAVMAVLTVHYLPVSARNPHRLTVPSPS
jgi:hypothetical protein